MSEFNCFYQLLGGPLHEVRKELLSRLNNAPTRDAQIARPVEDKFLFKHPVESPMQSDGDAVTTEVKIQEAIYRVEIIQGQNDRLFPIIVWEKWEVNDALDYLVNGRTRIVL